MVTDASTMVEDTLLRSRPMAWHSPEYKRYLRSNAWAIRKNAYYRRFNRQCAACGSLSTTAVPLTPPTNATDYRSGLSVIIQHSAAAPVLLGGEDAQAFEVKPNVPFPINNMDPGELLYVKTSSGTTNLQELWQGLGG
jgi:hypothetical protein